jgi:deoxyadenosine/deoxycytidine kinase
VGQHIIVAGNLGVGKTTLTKLLCERTSFIPYWEQPEKRPFQSEFSDNFQRWSLANQIDFLTFRGEQERIIRQGTATGIQDGSLDQDFHVFTKHLLNRGNLSLKEYHLYERVYSLFRHFLPPPDLIVRINAPIPSLTQRIEKRGRPTDTKIISAEELVDFELLLDDWLGNIYTPPVLAVDSHDNDPGFANSIDHLVATIEEILGSM